MNSAQKAEILLIRAVGKTGLKILTPDRKELWAMGGAAL